jgi:hypothetical protein
MEHLIEASNKRKPVHHNITYKFGLPSTATMVRRVGTEASRDQYGGATPGLPVIRKDGFLDNGLVPLRGTL